MCQEMRLNRRPMVKGLKREFGPYLRLTASSVAEHRLIRFTF